ncbi:glycosyltransferase family 4 protein [SAR202 cluster bacterium AD-812-D07_MRT_10900m]|nr:glycosyltransferase family 4 protein [SAR202 cluster bacterium AD-812-D07_MRT_10900m]
MPKRRNKEKPTSIALVANQNEIFYRLRMPWIRLLREKGYKVFAVVANGDWSDLIEAGGAEYVEWKLSRSGRNPLAEIGSVVGLARIFRRIKPDIVQNFHTKPNIYAPLAAKMAGVPMTVSTVTGLGYTFVERSGPGGSMARRLNLRMYRFSNRFADEVAFQNPDDMELLKANGGLAQNKGRMVPGGSGVDVTEYHPGTRESAEALDLRRSLGVANDAFVALFVGRLQLDKGLVEFVEAARIIRRNRTRQDIVFMMVGAPDPGNKRSLPEAKLAQWKAEGDVVFTGRREDVPLLMAMANTVTTPTFYREGLPRTLLEAAATGLPLIGTDMPGVREAIIDGVNGILIPTHDSVALARAVEQLADDPEMCQRYGNASLERAKNEFDHRQVVGEYLKMYEELWNR